MGMVKRDRARSGEGRWTARAKLRRLGCLRSRGADGVTDEEQKQSELTPEDVARLDELRSFVEGHLTDESSRQSYRTAAGKLSLLRTLLETMSFRADQTWELQSLGVVLGDVFVQELGCRWIIVEDQYGRDPALVVPGASVVLFPLTMISKRIEKGRAVDVFELFRWTAGEIRQLR
jgi:hypothetical protein